MSTGSETKTHNTLEDELKPKTITKPEKDLVLTFDLKTIDHLGLKLYYEIPSMLAELLSNSWDADAHNVTIELNDTDADDKNIIFTDDGIGMNFDELNDCFLKIGRNRRLESGSDTTTSGRFILGKKGLGKLSVFGVGKIITVTSIKNGVINIFEMNYEAIKNSNGTYKPNIIKLNESTTKPNGTSIKISSIQRKSPFDIDTLSVNLSSRFNVFSDDFKVTLKLNNSMEITVTNSLYNNENIEFTWEIPSDFKNNLTPEQYKFIIDNKITGSIKTANTPLITKKRGIILYSRGKLVQEPNSFNERANDNFYQYMFGDISVDFIDSDLSTDYTSTNRKYIVWDIDENSSLSELHDLISKLVSITSNEWKTRRREKKKDQIQEMFTFKSFQNFAQKLDTLNLLDSENAIKLLNDWQMIEAKELAKIAIGRIKTIDQFEKYVTENASETKIIQKFLEEFPWLLDSKMSKFEREITFSKLLKDKYDDSDLPEHNRRIDFLCSNENGIIHIIELKRPSIKITGKELTQISEYVEFFKSQYPQTTYKVKGYLISDNMKFAAGATTIKNALESEDIYVKSYSDLLKEARTYNHSFITSYEEIQEKRSK